MNPQDPASAVLPGTSPELVSGALEHLFRRESGRLVAALVRVLGVDQMALAEDVVQEALLKAVQVWPYHGIPEKPEHWILSVARNVALDRVRREQNFRRKTPAILHDLEEREGQGEVDAFSDGEIRDDALRLMFTCCHPVLTTDAQVALTLKTLCGFGVSEIAAAFLISEAAAAKKLVRARQRLRDAGVAFEVPAGAQLGERLDSVLQALYLMFNEGYKASAGESLIRTDLCREAVRLLDLLVQHPACARADAHALLALMLFNVARQDARCDDEGRLLLLAEQDRSQWDPQLIGLGMKHLLLSGGSERLTVFHFQAGIAACHVTARDHASTNWGRILELYDGLLGLNPNPVIALHRAVAVSRVHGPEVALASVEALATEPVLANYYLVAAVQGHLLESLGFKDAARQAYAQALTRTRLPAEQTFLRARLSALH